jgi:hypothetical protein
MARSHDETSRDPGEPGSVASGLLAVVRQAIAAEGGWLPFDRFMALALGHPRHGYYITRDPLGSAGSGIGRRDPHGVCLPGFERHLRVVDVRGRQACDRALRRPEPCPA